MSVRLIKELFRLGWPMFVAQMGRGGAYISYGGWHRREGDSLAAGTTAELDINTFDALFASDVRAPYFLVAALAPKMAAKGKGSIINLSSMAGQIGLAGSAAYGATKGALSSMTRAWAAM